MYRGAVLDTSVSQHHAGANGDAPLAASGKADPKSHVLSVPTSEASYPSTPLSIRLASACRASSFVSWTELLIAPHSGTADTDKSLPCPVNLGQQYLPQ